ncbi:cysteine desulfurase NifS [Lentisphaerota bacterium ZTH]|nr:cysteine desulfurase NifS [Lentisphaerota bacterium]WET06257.1 cysteine desulfurase NifS [Lentisphaerota bacterium ZTH]
MTDNKTIYMDNNATTAVDPEVFEAMRPYFCDLYGNPSSIHTFGGQVMHSINQARTQLADLLGAGHQNDKGEHTEIIFTSCGTESDSAAIWSALQVCPKKHKVVMSKVEHPAVLNLGYELERRGYPVSYVPVDSHGRLDMERLEEMVDDDTAVVSIMWANNETGNVYPVEECAEIAHRYGALFHTDAVQAVGKIPMNLQDSPIDMLSLSGHKLHAPKGIGALYVKRGIRFRPFLVGGHQEKGRRAGTENVPYIIALGKAAEVAGRYLEDENTRVKALRDRLEAGIAARVPKIRINGDLENRLPNTASISFEFIEGESILMLMDRLGICASSGSACTTGSLEPSHVLRAMGLPYTAAHGTIRFSLSRFNTEQEIDFVVESLPPIIERLREISPYWNE